MRTASEQRRGGAQWLYACNDCEHAGLSNRNIVGTMHAKLNLTEAFFSPPLPPPWPHDLLPIIQQRVHQSGRKVVVLDDDPTGTQTVHGVPVLTEWSVTSLASELAGDHAVFYILTNSRSLTQDQARELSRKLGHNLNAAAGLVHKKVEIISRSDSTLRGHFPDEVDALAQALGRDDLPYLIVPCFFEGGRYTFEDIHYVAEGEELTPAAQTSYARDAAFGYRHSDLKRWIEEKTAGRIPMAKVVSVSLKDIREGGPETVRSKLNDLNAGCACVVNAVAYKDLEVFVEGLLQAEEDGRRFLSRTAASFVRVRAGITPRALLERDEVVTDTGNAGLFIVGSYVPKTSDQLAALVSQDDVTGLEVNVASLLDDARQGGEIARVGKLINDCIRTSKAVAVYTSRELVRGTDAAGSLDIGRRVSKSLIEIVSLVRHQPRYLVAKGGITSSDVAVKALGVRRAMTMGQILPGVPVWRLGEESRYPHMAYIVFPGNVGGTDDLVEIKNRLAADTPA